MQFWTFTTFARARRCRRSLYQPVPKITPLWEIEGVEPRRPESLTAFAVILEAHDPSGAENSNYGDGHRCVDTGAPSAYVNRSERKYPPISEVPMLNFEAKFREVLLGVGQPLSNPIMPDIRSLNGCALRFEDNRGIEGLENGVDVASVDRVYGPAEHVTVVLSHCEQSIAAREATKRWT